MYEVKVKHFEGPLDLLLQLIEKERLDITQISLASITNEYIEYLSNLNAKSHDIAEFLVIASKLIYLKSKAILPSLQTAEEEEEIEELERKLQEYRKYKEAAQLLHETLKTGYRSFRRKNSSRFIIQEFVPPKEIDLKILLDIFYDVLNSIPKKEVEEKEEVFERKISVEEKIIEIKKYLKKEEKLNFREILKKAKTKYEIIVSFLAILDLIKQNEIEVSQDKSFDDIIIKVMKIKQIKN